MPDLEYTIKTVSELAGAEAVGHQLEMQIGKAKALGKDYSELQAQLDRVNGSLKNLPPQLQELHDAETKSSESAKFLHENHRAIHMLFHEMGSETVPGLGHAMNAALVGPLGPAVALVGAVGMLKKAFSDWNAEMDAEAESNAMPTFADGVAKVKASFENAASSIAAFQSNLANIATAQNTFANGLQRQLTLMREIATEQENQRKAAEARQKAEIASQVAAGPAAGGLTPEQGALKDTQIEIEAARAEHDAKRKAEQDALSTKEATLANEKIEQPRLKKNAIDLENHYAELDAKRAKSEDFSPKASQKIIQHNVGLSGETEETVTVEGRNQQLAAAGAEADKWRKMLEQLNANKGDITTPAQKEVASSNLEFANKQVENLTKGWHEYDALHTKSQNDAFDKLKADVGEAKKKATENETNIPTHENEVQDERKRQQVAFPGEDQQLHDRIEAIVSKAVEKLFNQPHGKDMLAGISVANDIEKAIRAAGLADQYQRTHQISQEDAAFLMKFANEHGANATSAEQSSAFVANRYGKTPERENQPVTPQNFGNLDPTEQFAVNLTKDLGGKADTVKQAADFLSQYINQNDRILQAVTTMSEHSYTALQQWVDKMEPRVSRIENAINNL